MGAKKIIYLLGVVAIILFGVQTVASIFTKKTTGPAIPPTPPLVSIGPTTIIGEPPQVFTYDSSMTAQLLNTVKDRPQLSANSLEAKNKLLQKLDNLSGVVYSSSIIKIEYVKAPDVFQAEILTTSITIAKQEAVSWMVSQGFIATDLCTLPLNFYLNFEVLQKLRDTRTIFNPLPDGC